MRWNCFSINEWFAFQWSPRYSATSARPFINSLFVRARAGNKSVETNQCLGIREGDIMQSINQRMAPCSEWSLVCLGSQNIYLSFKMQKSGWIMEMFEDDRDGNSFCVPSYLQASRSIKQAIKIKYGGGVFWWCGWMQKLCFDQGIEKEDFHTQWNEFSVFFWRYFYYYLLEWSEWKKQAIVAILRETD
jgi:hypothetical protein